MNEVINDLPEAIRQQAEKALAEIESAGSMILALKSGAQAYGFVQGLVCAGGITATYRSLHPSRLTAISRKPIYEWPDHHQ